MSEFRYIDDSAQLEGFVAGVATEERIAIDTEFVRERTYFPLLCLVQVASPSGIALIDPLAIEDLTPLGRMLADARVTKVLHAGRQDIEILLARTGVLPRPVFDTQLVAALLGHGAQVSYAALVEHMLGTRLAKAHTRTDWSRRPLDPDQQHYAADDVRYLLELEAGLRETLRQRGRAQWAAEELATLDDEAMYRTQPEDAWRRLKAARRLEAPARRLARALADWRERQAVRDDRPRQWIFRDSALFELARLAPRHESELATLRELPPAVARRHGAALVGLIARALAEPGAQHEPPGPPAPLDAACKALLDAMAVEVRACAARHGLSPELLATRASLERLVRGHRDVAALRGWRAELIGRRLLEICDGAASLQPPAGNAP